MFFNYALEGKMVIIINIDVTYLHTFFIIFGYNDKYKRQGEELENLLYCGRRRIKKMLLSTIKL